MVSVFTRDVQSDVPVTDEIAMVQVIEIHANDPEHRCIDWVAIERRSASQKIYDLKRVRSELEEVLSGHDSRLHAVEFL